MTAVVTIQKDDLAEKHLTGSTSSPSSESTAEGGITTSPTASSPVTAAAPPLPQLPSSSSLSLLTIEFDKQEKIHHVFEALFSLENLRVDDEGLVSHMNGRMLLPVTQLAQHRLMMSPYRFAAEEIIAAAKQTKKVVLEEYPSGCYLIGPFPYALQKSRCSVVLKVSHKSLPLQDSATGTASPSLSALIPTKAAAQIFAAPHRVLHYYYCDEKNRVELTFEDDRVAKQALFDLQDKKIDGVGLEVQIRIDPAAAVLYCNQSQSSQHHNSGSNNPNHNKDASSGCNNGPNQNKKQIGMTNSSNNNVNNNNNAMLPMVPPLMNPMLYPPPFMMAQFMFPFFPPVLPAQQPLGGQQSSQQQQRPPRHPQPKPALSIRTPPREPIHIPLPTAVAQQAPTAVAPAGIEAPDTPTNGAQQGHTPCVVKYRLDPYARGWKVVTRENSMTSPLSNESPSPPSTADSPIVVSQHAGATAFRNQKGEPICIDVLAEETSGQLSSSSSANDAARWGKWSLDEAQAVGAPPEKSRVEKEIKVRQTSWAEEDETPTAGVAAPIALLATTTATTAVLGTATTAVLGTATTAAKLSYAEILLKGRDASSTK